MDAPKKPTKRGGRFCVAGTPQKRSCKNTSYSPGIRMHQFPTDPATRQKWVKFVQRHRLDFSNPPKSASLCSAHFEDSSYACLPSRTLPGTETQDLPVYKVLIRGSVPTRDTSFPTEENSKEPATNSRERRRVSVRPA